MLSVRSVRSVILDDRYHDDINIATDAWDTYLNKYIVESVMDDAERNEVCAFFLEFMVCLNIFLMIVNLDYAGKLFSYKKLSS